MLIRRTFISVVSVCLTVSGAGIVSGQTTSTGSGQAYPNKPIRIIASAPGGGGDFGARLIAPGLSDRLGQPAIVDNRGGGIILGTIVSQAPPDGYTLLYTGSTVWVLPLMLDKPPFDPVRDLSPITLVTSSPTVVVVHPSLPVKSVKELIGLAKARPGELNYSSAGIGGSGHLSAELFKAMAGVNIVHVPYKGGGAGLNDLLSGQIQMTLDGGSALMQHIKSGRLRALAITSAQPSALFPGLPTVAASGLPGYESAQMNVMFAPAKTPEAIIRRLNQEMVRVLNTPDVKEKFFNSGVEVVGSSPEGLAATMKSGMTTWGRVIKEAGIKAQ